MSSRNLFLSQLTGVEFTGLTQAQAAGILMSWKMMERSPYAVNNQIPASGNLPEKEKLEIPKKVLYIEVWGKY